MGKLGAAVVAVVVSLGAAACQPMYDAPAQHMRDPAVVPRPAGTGSDVLKITYIEDCELHTRVMTHVPHDTRRASELLAKADDTASAQVRETEPVKKGDLLIDSVRTYSEALAKDPYSPEATLKLALAYDRAQRKGCALALLGRLAQLANHPTFATAAGAQLDDVEANRTWFSGYRKDALKAIGRP